LLKKPPAGANGFGPKNFMKNMMKHNTGYSLLAPGPRFNKVSSYCACMTMITKLSSNQSNLQWNTSTKYDVDHQHPTTLTNIQQSSPSLSKSNHLLITFTKIINYQE
jgi:hypothetical protein